ncbi:MAG: hypothetical protein QM791_08690 [Ferruginibacter sp.]
MNEATKINLSPAEMELVCNTEWLLTKHAVIDKVYRLFGAVAVSMQNTISKNKKDLPEVMVNSSPKISKGENYQQLPYVMLDYPRHFDKNDTLAIRTFFWWGNFFSITLQVSGSYKAMLLPQLNERFSFLQENNYWICTNDDPWQHHFEHDNYTEIKKIDRGQFTTILNREYFIKIARKLSLTEWQSAPGFAEKTFEEMLEMAKHQAPSL